MTKLVIIFKWFIFKGSDSRRSSRLEEVGEKKNQPTVDLVASHYDDDDDDNNDDDDYDDNDYDQGILDYKNFKKYI